MELWFKKAGLMATRLAFPPFSFPATLAILSRTWSRIALFLLRSFPVHHDQPSPHDELLSEGQLWTLAAQ